MKPKFYLKSCQNIKIDVLRNNNVIVFFDDKKGSVLYKVGTNGMKTVKQYGYINSVSTYNMRRILEDVDRMFPSSESGLVFWSHGSGWLPTGSTRSFGDDEGEAIDINSLSCALVKKYDYIIFDACYMGSMEVLTEIYPFCRYLIFSPGIVPSQGIMGKDTMSCILFGADLEKRLIDLCKCYMAKHYLSYNVSVSLICTDYAEKALDFCKDIQINTKDLDMTNFYLYEFRKNKVFYDLGNLLRINSSGKTPFENLVVYHSNSEGIAQNIDISVFIPSQYNIDYHNLYRQTKWNVTTKWLNKFGY